MKKNIVGWWRFSWKFSIWSWAAWCFFAHTMMVRETIKFGGRIVSDQTAEFVLNPQSTIGQSLVAMAYWDIGILLVCTIPAAVVLAIVMLLGVVVLWISHTFGTKCDSVAIVPKPSTE